MIHAYGSKWMLIFLNVRKEIFLISLQEHRGNFYMDQTLNLLLPGYPSHRSHKLR